MTGQAHWLPLLLVVLAGIAAGWLLVADVLAAQRRKIVLKRVLCPACHRAAVAEVLADAKTGEITGVRSCTAIAGRPFEAVCPRGCLTGLRAA